jgi:hypothetical protein
VGGRVVGGGAANAPAAASGLSELWPVFITGWGPVYSL